MQKNFTIFILLDGESWYENFIRVNHPDDKFPTENTRIVE